MAKEFFDFYKELYDREITRKQEVESGMSSTVSLMALLFAFCGYYLLNWPDMGLIQKHFMAYSAFASFFIFGVILFVISIIDIAKFYKMSGLVVLDNAEKIDEYYRNTIIPHCETHNLEDHKQEFFNAIQLEYIRTSSENANRNDAMSDLHYKARKCLFFASILFAVAFAPYFVCMGDELNMMKMDIHKTVEIPIQQR